MDICVISKCFFYMNPKFRKIQGIKINIERCITRNTNIEFRTSSIVLFLLKNISEIELRLCPQAQAYLFEPNHTNSLFIQVRNVHVTVLRLTNGLRPQ
jgi:hypothetical protein